MADVGQIILQAAQGIVQQRQNQQRLAMQAQQMAFQIQQAERTLKLQREELDMRKQMMEHKEESLEVEKLRAETGERAVGVQERQITLQERRAEAFDSIEQLLKESEIDLNKARASQLRAEINSGSSPEDILKTRIAKNPAFVLSLDKSIASNAKQAAMAQFMAEGKVEIGDTVVERPQGMLLLSEDTVEREAITTRGLLKAAEQEAAQAKAAASQYEGKTTTTAKMFLHRRDIAEQKLQQYKQRLEEMNQYSLMYKRINSASQDKEWREIAIRKMSGGNGSMQQLFQMYMGQKPAGITTPQGITLYTPMQRLSFIGGSRGGKPGKAEQYTSDSGITYDQRLQSVWSTMKTAEPETEGWNVGMGLLKSLTGDTLESKAEAGALFDALREEWAVDTNDSEEMEKFKTVMRAYVKERGFKFK